LTPQCRNAAAATKLAKKVAGEEYFQTISLLSVIQGYTFPSFIPVRGLFHYTTWPFHPVMGPLYPVSSLFRSVMGSGWSALVLEK